MEYKDKQGLNLNILVDEVSTTVTYVGKAEVGVEKLEAKWQIFKVTVSGAETQVAFAENTDKFSHSWEIRDTYDYLKN